MGHTAWRNQSLSFLFSLFFGLTMSDAFNPSPRHEKLAFVTPNAKNADCSEAIEIQLLAERDSEKNPIIKFLPAEIGCTSGTVFVGNSEDGSKHITLVPSGSAFMASVKDDKTGAVWSIGPDGNGEMFVTMRRQEDYPEEHEQDPPNTNQLSDSQQDNMM